MGHIVAIGEILWDVFDVEGRMERWPGGAPFNVAVHCHSLGARASIVSRVGRDDLGEEIVARARELGVDTDLIQWDERFPTGQVRVRLDEGGEPSFDICSNAAYDYLVADLAALSRVREADAVYFGTLAQRHPVARRAIARLLGAAGQALVFCDLNLRPPHCSRQIVRNSLAACDVVKVNEDELWQVQGMVGQGDLGEDHFLSWLLDSFDLALICLTLGARGCLLRSPAERVEAAGYACQVVDTVGSGDAFAAALIVKRLAGWDLARIADFANRVGAYVATVRGATPPLPSGIEFGQG